jgi:hypothetical protein
MHHAIDGMPPMRQSFQLFLLDLPSIAAAHRETQETLEIIQDAIRSLQGQVDRSRRIIERSSLLLRSVSPCSVRHH